MPETTLRRVKPPTRPLKQSPDDIVHFPLKGLLPQGHMLALNMVLGTLSHISHNSDGALLLAEQQFTNSEICVLKPLLESYPHFCPYEVLLANFNSGNVTEQAVDRCRERLQEAQEAGDWDQEMRPVRNVLSRTRLKMQTFGIDIFSILETGYVLMFQSRRRQQREA
ncbi:MAG: hypothetical protein E6I97_14700 [Chloroflexi bacterium]|nr:MAG: hypothetical protein E6I97_14700 [Chloroflexota bacterium]